MNESGSLEKARSRGLSSNLDRLGLDYVDMVFCHRPDPFTPTETVVQAMTSAVRSGMATCWGTSEWSAQQITGSLLDCEGMGLEPPQFGDHSTTCFTERGSRTSTSHIQCTIQHRYDDLEPALFRLADRQVQRSEVPDGSRATVEMYGWMRRN